MTRNFPQFGAAKSVVLNRPSELKKASPQLIVYTIWDTARFKPHHVFTIKMDVIVRRRRIETTVVAPHCYHKYGNHHTAKKVSTVSLGQWACLEQLNYICCLPNRCSVNDVDETARSLMQAMFDAVKVITMDLNTGICRVAWQRFPLSAPCSCSIDYVICCFAITLDCKGAGDIGRKICVTILQHWT
ncbi:hypothetical protein RB195_022779 [Necator americanus]|uniref:Uncharacterized protein n=1 Tax=Necator americanus TaxID=51031 RepID=A0ABR1EGT8_NECAM